MEDLLSVLPFGGRFDMVTLKGSTLKEAFEHSVRRYGKGSGELLQVGGTFSSLLFSVFQNSHPSCRPYYTGSLFLRMECQAGHTSSPCASHMPASRRCLSHVRLPEPLQHTGHRRSLQQRQRSQPSQTHNGISLTLQLTRGEYNLV